MATEAPKATETVVSTGVTPAAVEKVEEKKVEEWKPRISVFNLPAGVTSQDELRELCKPFGTITNVEFVPAKGNRNAFGFVTFKTKGDAEYAIYRLNEENFGGKVPVRAKWPPEKDASKQKEGESGADGKPKKNKKPMTSLSLLTPKNVASNAQHQNAAPLNKKGWDIPAQGQNNQQGGQKKQYQQVQQGGDNSQNQNQYPKGPRGKKGGPNQGRPNQGQPGGQQQQGGNPKPVQHQPRPNQGGQQAGGQHPNQPHPNQGGPKGKKNQQHQGQQNDASVPQQNQPQNTQPAHPQQNQQPRGKAPQQNQQQVHHEAAPQQNPPQQNNAQQQNPQQPRNPRKKQPKKAYVVTVADGKTGLPLHVINLSKPQFDQYIGPLVVKPAPQ